ncbi:hypothetical protein AB835_04405 [Candidatus Endobugula sertula]|uniref:Uncharacterized protein n=1 Tax=Candidatus Endobugula sertula TaxID=62101 RepID=A0A1D2QRW0_9GAMM|nr:hypothetical protein AB835_04405 [Candidatus Endobugula sertula]
MNTHGFPSPILSTTHSYQVLRQPPVGEESTDLQQSTLKPVKQSAESATINTEVIGGEERNGKKHIKSL